MVCEWELIYLPLSKEILIDVEEKNIGFFYIIGIWVYGGFTKKEEENNWNVASIEEEE